MNNEQIREIKPKELVNETESSWKVFRIKYQQWDDIIPKTREYKRKQDIIRILDNPVTTNARVWVIEMIDNG